MPRCAKDRYSMPRFDDALHIRCDYISEMINPPLFSCLLHCSAHFKSAMVDHSQCWSQPCLVICFGSRKRGMASHVLFAPWSWGGEECCRHISGSSEKAPLFYRTTLAPRRLHPHTCTHTHPPDAPKRTYQYFALAAKSGCQKKTPTGDTIQA
jgi:hypothetical protein